jgi:D-arabinose 1-dehydrogenase-like Zn-dependent alcohol dehydrogenase
MTEGWRVHEWGGPLHWDEWEIPGPGPGEVQIQVEACGVGLTVLNNLRGENWDDPEMLPRVPGHEIVGRVVATGDDVDEPAVDDRVLAYFYLSDFTCAACRAGREDRCASSGGRIGIHRDGGYARLVNLPAGNAVAFPYDMDAAEATVIPDAVATPVHVCRTRLQLREGERVVVIGAGGGVGAHLVQVARACGAEVTGLDRTEAKLELVERLGAAPVDSSDFGKAAVEGADAVVDLVGSAESLGWALDQLGQGGRLCLLTTFKDVVLPVAPRTLVAREIAVMGSHYATRAEVAEAARLVADGTVRPVLGRTLPAPEVERLHEALRAGTLLGRGAIRFDD